MASAAASAFAVALCAAVAGQSGLADVVNAFAPHDLDGDGVHEVRSLRVLRQAGAPAAPAVVVLVENRLLAGAEDGPFRGALERFVDDIAAEGHCTILVAAEAHTGPPRQDGRTVLGLRRLLQRVQAAHPLAGAVLVGHFPDALLVRTCNWRRVEPLQLPGPDGKPVSILPPTTNVRCVPEIVAHRCDVVLADLDGAWESVYVREATRLPSVTAVFGDVVPETGGPCVAMQTGAIGIADAFVVRDGAAVADRVSFAVRLDAADRDHECAALDRSLGNPLAQPEIAVSRIDARGVARSAEPTSDRVAWRFDEQLEQRLLCEYFARNHAFRVGSPPAAARRPAAISHGLGSGMASLRAADPAWRDFAAEGYDVDGADLAEVVRWLQRPAVLRTLRAHSDGFCAAFQATTPALLAAAVGVPSSWQPGLAGPVPTWATHARGAADFAFYRALWANRVLPEQPYLMIHTGCEALSPPHCVERAHDDPLYGERGHAESILFFTPCVAMVGRAKVFYDEPRGFCDALAAGATFGDAWRRYFAIEGAASDWAEVGDDIGRKRAYFWSVVGDWTLRLPR